jgi:hypothetical protein
MWVAGYNGESMMEKSKRSAAKRKRDAIKESGIITYLLVGGMIVVVVVIVILMLLHPTIGNIYSQLAYDVRR